MASLLIIATILIATLLIISGILMVVFGQSISCFVAIEKNTRATHEIIRAQMDTSLNSGNPDIAEDSQNDDDDDGISNDNLFK